MQISSKLFKLQDCSNRDNLKTYSLNRPIGESQFFKGNLQEIHNNNCSEILSQKSYYDVYNFFVIEALGFKIGILSLLKIAFQQCISCRLPLFFLTQICRIIVEYDYITII